MLAVMVLRRIAFLPKGQVGSADRYLVALFRSVTQRSEEKRTMPWKDLLRDFYDALVASTEAQLAGVRARRPAPTA